MVTGIRGEVTIDLSVDPADDWNLDRRQLQVLDHCPDGVTVIVDMGRRKYVTQDAARALHIHGSRLDLVVRGADPKAVQEFVLAGRCGDWSVAG